VDDTLVYRKIVSDILSEMPGVEVVGTAHNGNMAVTYMNTLKPDLLVLDVDMPEMNGLEVLAHIKKNRLNVGAIMLSSVAQESRDYTIQALELGAFDFISKPTASSPEEGKRAVGRLLRRVVAAFIRKHEIRCQWGKGKSRPHADVPFTSLSSAAHQGTCPASQIVGIGVSTGGPNALKEMLPQLPDDMGVPILIVQHMPPMFTRSLAKSLNTVCKMEVLEAEDHQAVRPNVIYIAPGGRQMKVVKRPKRTGHIIRVTDDPSENGCRPAVDYLFRSIAQVYGAGATAVIMTGMGSDGKLGMRLMKRHGAATIAQEKDSCVVYGMPREVVDAGLVDVITPLETMAQAICRTVQQGKEVLV